MCGIAGLFQRQPLAPQPLLTQLVGRLRHRGPDDHGWLLFGPQGVRRGRGDPGSEPVQGFLVHRRLSILDLSEAGWQPMSSPDGRYHLVFNGEIYNYLELRQELEKAGYSFRSHSDSEVLLAAYSCWGRAALRRLVGMFAFAVLDSQRRRLFLARDFFGIKPLYYVQLPTGFAFASEIKALLELPGLSRRVQARRLYEYLRFGWTDHGTETLFAAIQQVPAAHYLEVPWEESPVSLQPVPYWQASVAEPLDLSLTEASRRLRELFLDSVRLHLRSDVPVGAALSGGIDSSAIVAAMRHLEPRLQLHAFSYVADDAALSEERWIRIAGQAAGARLHLVTAAPGDLLADLDNLIYQQDEPFGSTSIYAQYCVFRRARQAGITVMLDGQGADELLAGYRPYIAARLASLLRRGRLAQAWRLLHDSGQQPGSGGRTHLLLRATALALPRRWRAWAAQLSGRSRPPAWLNTRWFARQGVLLRSGYPALPEAARRQGEHLEDLLRQELYRSLVWTSLPALLRYEDRNSMAHSVESRVPFLTPALVDFLLRLPEEYLLGPDGTSKNVFRLAMRGLVPDAVLDRRDKIGFATPERRWLTVLQPWVEQVLHSPAAQALPALELRALREEWRQALAGRRPFDFRIWRWVNVIRWAERFQVDFGENLCV